MNGVKVLISAFELTQSECFWVSVINKYVIRRIRIHTLFQRTSLYIAKSYTGPGPGPEPSPVTADPLALFFIIFLRINKLLYFLHSFIHFHVVI